MGIAKPLFTLYYLSFVILCEIKCGIDMAKAAFNKKTLFTGTLGLKFEEETSKMLHLERSFVWC
jgi:hypothetical protein